MALTLLRSSVRRGGLVVLVAAGLVIAVGGCGRKGAPERPPGSDYPRPYPTR